MRRCDTTQRFRLACCIATLGFGTAAPAAVIVSRDLPDGGVFPDSEFTFTVHIALTSPAPAGLILTESPPSGWTVSDATWTPGDARATPVSMPPVLLAGQYKWLFDPLGQPAADGTLTITARTPAGEAQEGIAFAGAVKWTDAASDSEQSVGGDTTVTVLDDPVSAWVAWVNPTTVRVAYERNVVGGANTDNYAFAPALTVTGVQFTDGVYELTTEEQTPGQSTSLTILNVTDGIGNIVSNPPTLDLFTLALSAPSNALLSFGHAPDASSEYDPGVDTLAAEPGNDDDPTAHFRCASGELLSDDLRAPAGTTRWRLVVDPGAGRADVELSWALPVTGAARAILLQRIDPDTEMPLAAPVDMTASAALTVAEYSEFEIAYALLSQATLHVSAGWNLIGSPVMTSQTVADVLADSQGRSLYTAPVWAQSGGSYTGWADDAPFLPEYGCWVYAAQADETRTVEGIVADGLVRLLQGWNLVSPPTDCNVPADGSITLPIWRWDTAQSLYAPVADGELLRAGTAYWIRTTAPCTVEF